MSSLLLAPVGLLLLCGLLAFAFRARPVLAELFGAWGACLASLLGLLLTAAALIRGDEPSLALRWNPALGASFTVGMDMLSGVFLLPIYALGAAAAAFGAGYMRSEHGRRAAGTSWLFYALLVAGMAMVVLARNAMLFLVAWETMSLSSFFLVTTENEKESVRQAGVTYLIATQIGTAFLFVLFLLLGVGGAAVDDGAGAATLDFSRLGPAGGGAASAAFLLALVGFGTKAGIVPLHVWLPEAHPAAPSHVSALMSGVMIKTGIYGIVRVLTFLGAPAVWWGWTLVAVGAASGILGVLFALAQHDIKRLLAYHSVENIGIICLALGLGLLGSSLGVPVLAVLGFAAGLLHVVNHALFKGLLFLGAGAAVHAAGTRDLDMLGGLARRMPVTAAAFFIGAISICGLPPFNGFVSEFLLMSGALGAVAGAGVAAAAAGALVVASLALIGGLAAACFTKAFGVAFLGEARTGGAAIAREAPASMLAPMLALAAGCLAVGLLGSFAAGAIAPLAAALAGPSSAGSLVLLPAREGLSRVLVAAAILGGIAVLLVVLRALLLRGRTAASAPTWDCGYGAATPRMQYTSSSFAQPLLAVFRGLLGTRQGGTAVEGMFPRGARFSSETPDPFEHGMFRPLFRGMGWLFSRLRLLQHGRLQLYVLYIAAALVILLVWKLG